MNSATVESTTLVAVAYDESRNTLQLEFRSGAIYQCTGVPAGVHQELLAAPSKGSYFNRVIRGRFPYRLLVNPDSSTSSALRSEGAW
jgi:KTSC domain